MSTYSEALLLALAVETDEKNAQWGAYLKRKKKKNTSSASILSFNHLSDYEFIRSEG